MEKKFKEFVAEAKKTYPGGLTAQQYASHERGSGGIDKSKDPIENGSSHNKSYGSHKAKIGDRVTMGTNKQKRGTVHNITKEKTVAGMKNFHHVKWDDGGESKHRDHDLTVWRHR